MESFFTFLENNSIYIVMFILLTIWFGIFAYLNKLDTRLKHIEKEIEKEEGNKNE